MGTHMSKKKKTETTPKSGDDKFWQGCRETDRSDAAGVNTKW